jgi:hypothetical protein
VEVIANHLGKGIRTVQSWEQAIGLPVRRPHGRRNGVVLAHCDEIELRERFSGVPAKPNAEIAHLSIQRIDLNWAP